MTMRRSHLIVHVVGVVICILISVIGFAVGVFPVVQARAQLKDDRHELSLRREMLADYEEKIDRVNQRIDELQKEVTATAVVLQDLTVLNQQLARLASLASQCGLIVHGVVPGEVMITTRCRLVPIRLTGQGGYQAAATLLRRFHELFLDIHVDGFELISDPQSTSLTKNIQFDLMWFAASRYPSHSAVPGDMNDGIELNQPSPPGASTVYVE